MIGKLKDSIKNVHSARFRASILARTCTPTPLYTCLRMQIVYVLSRDKEFMISLE